MCLLDVFIHRSYCQFPINSCNVTQLLQLERAFYFTLLFEVLLSKYVQQSRTSYKLLIANRPVGRGGSRGFARTPLLAPKRFYMQCYSTFYWSTSLAAIENYRCPSKSGCSYAGFFLEDQHRTRQARNALA